MRLTSPCFLYAVKYGIYIYPHSLLLQKNIFYIFCKKNAKFSSAGAPHPDPRASGGFAPRPLASSGWGLCPQTPINLRRLGAPPPDPKTAPPIANSWLRTWAVVTPDFISLSPTLMLSHQSSLLGPPSLGAKTTAPNQDYRPRTTAYSVFEIKAPFRVSR